MPIEQYIIQIVTDTTQLEKGQAKVGNVLTTVNQKLAQTQQQLAREEGAVSKLYNSLGKLSDQSKEAVQDLLKLSGKEILAGFEKHNLTVQDYIDTLEEADAEAQKFGKTQKSNSEQMERSRARLTKMREELMRMADAGEHNTVAFYKLQKAAGALADDIGDVQARIQATASDTMVFDGLLSAAQGLAGGFAIAQSAAALFGEENKDLQETLLKVNASMSLLQGLQQIQNVIQKESAAATLLYDLRMKAQIATQTAYTFVVGTSTGALKAFRIALAATGIGLVVLAIGYLITNFEKVKEVVVKFLPNLEQLGKAFTYVKNAVTDFIGVTSQAQRDTEEMFAKQLELSQREEQQIKANQDYAKAKAEKDKRDAEEREKAQAKAIAQQRELLEQQIAGAQRQQLAVEEGTYAYRNLQIEIIRLTGLLEALEKTGEKALLPIAKADKEIAELTKGRIAEVQAAEEAFTKDMKIEGQKRLDATDAINKAMATKTKITLKDLQETNRMTEQEKVELALQTAGQITGIFSEAFKQRTEREIQAVNDQRTRLKELREAGVISAKEAERRAKELDEKERQLKTKGAQRDKAIAIFQATIATAQAVVKSLAVGLPQGAILAAIAGALGAAQIALIASRPIPKFAKGKKGMYEGLGIVGEAGAELIERNGRMHVAAHPQLTYLKKHDKVYTPAETAKMLSAIPAQARAQAGATHAQAGTATFDYDRMGKSIAKHLPQPDISFDKDGFNIAVRRGQETIKYLDKRRKF